MDSRTLSVFEKALVIKTLPSSKSEVCAHRYEQLFFSPVSWPILCPDKATLPVLKNAKFSRDSSLKVVVVLRKNIELKVPSTTVALTAPLTNTKLKNSRVNAFLIVSLLVITVPYPFEANIPKLLLAISLIKTFLKILMKVHKNKDCKSSTQKY